MANTLLVKRSSVQGKVPVVGDLQLGEMAINTFDGRLYLKRNNGTNQIIEVGALSSAQRNVSWNPVAGAGPVSSYEYDDQAWLFSQGSLQALVAFIKVPTSDIAGSQIKMRMAHYTPGATGNFKFRTTTTLIRKNTDAINSTTNQYQSTNADQALTTTLQYLEVIYDITDSAGAVNSVAVAAGDLLKIQIQRIATTGTDDTNDVRLLPGSTEILFA